MLQQLEGQVQLCWREHNTVTSVTHLQSEKPNSVNRAQAGKS